MPNKLIEVQNLNYCIKWRPKRFRPIKKYYILKNINLTINQGDCISIFGKNGAGKTTLIEVLFGFRELYEGKIIFTDLFKQTQIGYVFQDYEFLNWKIQPIVDLYLGVYQRTPADLEELLVKLDFLEFHTIKYLSDFSNGQKQKFKLILMLLQQPTLLVLDEINTSLDYNSRKTIINYLYELKQTKKITMILISHNEREIARLADKLYYLNDRTIQEVVDLPENYDDKVKLVLKYVVQEVGEGEALFDEIY